MREIKFRAWDKEHKTKQAPSLNMLVDSLLGTAHWQFGYEELRPMPDTVLMQFTGLKDKNGKEIYEGDVVEKMISGKKVRVSVLWDDSLTGFTGLKNILDCEIIGNIYENPELIK